MTSYTFCKEEKLCSRKIIGEMFLSGNSFLCHPLKVAWIHNREISSIYPVQVAFSVPKRNFKKAHDRNRIKRLVRESYRYQKNLLYQFLESNGQKIGLMIVYIGKEKTDCRQIESAMNRIISRLEREIITGIDLTVGS